MFIGIKVKRSHSDIRQQDNGRDLCDLIFINTMLLMFFLHLLSQMTVPIYLVFFLNKSLMFAYSDLLIICIDIFIFVLMLADISRGEIHRENKEAKSL